MKNYQFALKRAFDIVVSIAGIIVLAPFALFVMALLKFTSRGPVFFIQVRIGRFGQPFRCVKFRTMSVGADISGSVTTANDRRVTPIGSVLRRFKLDEFPQLWNVLIGKMSFVGPRPDVPGYADLLVGEDRRILALRPGITGPASIFFRYEEALLADTQDPVSFNDQRLWPVKVRINRRYLERWSFSSDIGFILITIIPAMRCLFKQLPDSPRTIRQFEAVINDRRLS